MTRKEKIRILKAMLPLIDTVNRVMGLCGAYRKVTCLWPEKYEFGQIGLTRPRVSYGAYWYDWGIKGDNQRRAAIRRAIKRLQT